MGVTKPPERIMKAPVIDMYFEEDGFIQWKHAATVGRVAWVD